MTADDNSQSRLVGQLQTLRHQIDELRDALHGATEEEPGRQEPGSTGPPSPDAAPVEAPAGSEPAAAPDALLSAIIRLSRDGILAVNREGIVTVWNAAMERIFGIRAPDALGSNALAVFSQISGAGDETFLVRALQGEVVEIAERPFSVGGTDRTGFFEGQYFPLTAAAGRVDAVVGFIQDVTGRREAAEVQLSTEARYRELFENASDMVYTLDLDGRITSLNKAAERLTGYSRAEALRMKLVDLVAPDHRDVARSIIQRHLAGEPPATHEIDILTKSGHRLALEISTHLIAREGRPIGLQGIVRDITERKKTEEALQQAKGKLEAWVHELEQRTREMTLLSEMGDMLRACLTTEEAYSVIVRVAQQIFPVQLGALYVITPSRNLVEAVALWGDTSFAERVFAPDDCWALRRGRVHWVEEPAVGLICKHLHQPTQEGYLCVPMMAQSEALGVLHLTQPRDARLTEAKQRLAVA
ncbi:MAG: PAS domain S-box protein, partial [Acidobacteriota bacterium]